MFDIITIHDAFVPFTETVCKRAELAFKFVHLNRLHALWHQLIVQLVVGLAVTALA